MISSDVALPPRSKFIPNVNPKSLPSTLLLLGIVAILAYLADDLGTLLVLRPQMIWPLWLGCALLIAVLLSTPRRLWIPLVLAGLLGFTLCDLRAGLSIRSIGLFLLSDTVEILIAAWSVSYFLGSPRLNSIRALSRYLLMAVIISPIAAAFIAPLAIGGNYWLSWKMSFLTEALALLTLTPAILGWVEIAYTWKQKRRAYYIEVAALLIGLIIVGYIVFQSSGGRYFPELLYSLVPFLLWSALRFGTTGVGTTMIIVAFLSIWSAVHNRGPFVGSDPLEHVLSLQLFLLFATAPIMFLAAIAEQRRQAHESLRESDKRFRLVANTAPVLIWMSGPDKLCTYFNQPWLEFTGRPLAAELGNGWAEGVYPQDFQRCLDTYVQAFDRREEFRMEYRLRRHDGEYRWVLDHGVPRFTPDNSFAGYIGSCIDMTDAKVAEAKLAQASERLQLAMDAGGIGGWELDLRTGTNITFGKSHDLLGLPFMSTSGSSEAWKRIHPEDLTPLLHSYEIAKQGHSEFNSEFRIISADGSVHWLRSRGKFIYRPSGDPERVLGTSIDITERKQAEEALRESEERLRLAVRAGKMFAYSWDAATDEIERSGESAHILGIDDSATVTGSQILPRVHPDDRDRLNAALSELTIEQPNLQIAYRMVRPDGSVLWLERNSRAYFSPQGDILRIVGMVADITERKRAEEMLSSLSRRLIEAQEADRSRIARELHDDIGQQLALVAVKLEQLTGTPLQSEDEARNRIAHIRQRLATLSSSIHGLSHQLHSSSLRHLGLVAAMRNLCREMSAQHGVEIDFNEDAAPQQAPTDVSLCLFRVLQEALQNAIKHSGVRHFDVGLAQDSHSIRLTISDLGLGFNVQESMEGTGLGLVSMRERLKLVNGELSIRSHPHSGTTISARVPVASQSDSALAAG